MPVYQDYPLAPLSWFRTGGNAAWFLKADTMEELQEFMKNPGDFYVLGNGSNTLIRDGGVKEKVVKLGRGFREIVQDGRVITVGAACLNRTVVEQTCAWGLSGLEFLIGIPGSIGGAIAMNAGACGSEVQNTLQSIRVLKKGGHIRSVSLDDLNMQYRQATLPNPSIIINATFKLKADDPDAIRARIDKFLSHRDAAQPVSGKTGGSTFKNPEGRSAWELIDAVGLRGHRIGGAAFSDKHCNFIINTDGTAADIEALAELARIRVQERFKIKLEWEVKRIGTPASRTG